MKKFRVIFLLALIIAPGTLLAQENYGLVKKQSSVIVLGTSTLHDWEMNANNLHASINVYKKGNDISKINSVNFSVKAADILSDNSIMDDKAHDALRAEKYPNIDFKMMEANTLSTSGNNLSGTINGAVTIAGVTRTLSIPFRGNIEGNSISIHGEKALKMSDFKITPPTAILGTLKTGNEVTVKFDLEFIKTEGKLSSQK